MVWLTRLRDERGQSIGPELLVILALAIVCWGFLAWLGRLTATSQDLANTAQAAARAASMAPDVDTATAAAKQAVQASNLGGSCAGPAQVHEPLTTVPGPQGGWRGGSVTVTVTCTIATRESGHFQGRTISASDTQIVDRYAAVAP